jgi:hypothetical protein
MTSAHCKMSEQQVVAALDQLFEIRPEDITDDWIHVMSKRLLSLLNNHIASLEAIKYDNKTAQPTPAERLVNARSLASLKDTLRDVTKMKTQHDASLEGRKARRHDDARAELRHRVAGELVAKRKEDRS